MKDAPPTARRNASFFWPELPDLTSRCQSRSKAEGVVELVVVVVVVEEEEWGEDEEKEEGEQLPPIEVKPLLPTPFSFPRTLIFPPALLLVVHPCVRCATL